MSGAGVRKALVVFQFTLSVIIIFSSLVMWKQTDFLLKKDLGYDKHSVITVWLDDEIKYSFENLRAEMLAHTSIEAVAFGGASPMEVNGYSECNRVDGPYPQPLHFYGANVDEHLIPALKFEIVAGRNFQSGRASDSSGFIITQKAADLLGFANPVGQKIRYDMFGPHEGEIIGVIKDFQNDDIHIPVRPVVFVLGHEKYLANMFVRYREGQHEEALGHLKKVFAKIQPGILPYYTFLDGDFERQLYAEKLLSNISIWFTVISISIACLGLFGLVLFNTQRRTKEIGIRKVLGASVRELAVMLSRDFLSPVMWSFLIAFPIAWWIMQQFLSRYESRISITTDTFVIIAVVVSAMVLITVSYQSLKAAVQNPVDSLKTE